MLKIYIHATKILTEIILYTLELFWGKKNILKMQFLGSISTDSDIIGLRNYFFFFFFFLTSTTDGFDAVNPWNSLWERLIFSGKKKFQNDKTKPQIIHFQMCRNAF